jgi:hypothetical protein
MELSIYILCNWFLMMPSIATKFQYVNSPFFIFPSHSLHVLAPTGHPQVRYTIRCFQGLFLLQRIRCTYTTWHMPISVLRPVVPNTCYQTSLLAIQSWLKTWRMKANETKSVHVTFTTRRAMCSPVHINDVQIPQENHVKYVGLHLDRWFILQTFLQNVNNLESPSPRCTGYFDVSPNSLSATNSSSTKLYSNPSGHTAFNSGVQHPIQTSKF